MSLKLLSNFKIARSSLHKIIFLFFFIQPVFCLSILKSVFREMTDWNAEIREKWGRLRVNLPSDEVESKLGND